MMGSLIPTKMIGTLLRACCNALAAVEEEALAAPAQHQARRSPPSRRHRPGGAEEGDLEIHATIVGASLAPVARRL